MISFGFVDKQKSYLVAAFALLVAFIAPSIVFAAQVTERSVALSSSSAGATAVEYTVKFTPESSATEVVLDFCSNSPLIGSTCTPPTGFNLGAATVSGFTKDTTNSTNSTYIGAGTITQDVENTIVLSGVTNPTNAGALYARILTYDTGDSATYTATDPDNAGANPQVDEGGVAMSITPTIGVSGAVLESMTFCVGGGSTAFTANCGGALPAPTLELGADVGGVIALDSSLVYTGAVQTQISTNAVGGAIISLKSNRAGCGGLVRAGAASNAAGCGILPATDSSDISAGQAKFGVRTGTAVGVSGADPSGALEAYDPDGVGGTDPFYSSSVYRMGYVSGDATGVTSTYGDPILYTANAPANNMGMPLTFGASAANNTAAGLYSADLSLIATGKF